MNGNSSKMQTFANVAHRINLVFVKFLALLLETILLFFQLVYLKSEDGRVLAPDRPQN